MARGGASPPTLGLTLGADALAVLLYRARGDDRRARLLATSTDPSLASPLVGISLSIAATGGRHRTGDP